MFTAVGGAQTPAMTDEFSRYPAVDGEATMAVLLIGVAAVFIVPNLGTIGGYGPPLIDPLFWLLGFAGVVMLALVWKPYRPG
jgi:hypothetical protein